MFSAAAATNEQSELTDKLLTSVAHHAQWIKTAAHQRLVGIEIDQNLHLV